MKYILTILLSCIFSFAHAEDDVRMQQALSLCQEGNYNEAITLYESILTEQKECATLYYNLGYAYYKSGMLGKAILNFERSRRLNPNDADVLANLEQAYANTDQMQTIEPVFFVRWWQSFSDMMSSDGWAVTFIVFFVLVLVGIGAFMFSDVVSLRKLGFFSAIIFLIFGIISLVISLDKRSEIINSSEAIIMSASVTMTTSPDKNGSEMAVIHEGTHVQILSELGEYIEVQLKDGNIGWLKKTDVEVI